MPERLGDVLQESMLVDHFLCNPLEHAAGRDEKIKTNLEHFSILVKTTHCPLQKGSGVLSPAAVL